MPFPVFPVFLGSALGGLAFRVFRVFRGCIRRRRRARNVRHRDRGGGEDELVDLLLDVVPQMVAVGRDLREREREGEDGDDGEHRHERERRGAQRDLVALEPARDEVDGADEPHEEAVQAAQGGDLDVPDVPRGERRGAAQPRLGGGGPLGGLRGGGLRLAGRGARLGAVQFILGFLFILPIVICLMIDLRTHHSIVWSGYVCCGLASIYIILCLPLWFKKKNPVIFVPISMTALLLTALYVSIKTGGGWFLSFAFPVGGALILLVEAIIVLCRYTVGAYPHRLLYIFGGAIMVLGGLLVLLEFLINVTFKIPMTWWSIYPLTALFLVGLMVLVIAANQKLRRTLHKKLFI